MISRDRISHYLRVIARYIRKPETLGLRRYYFLPDLYEALDQPWVRARDIATVLDIGANVGSFTFTTQPLFPNAQFYSFEPLPDCYQKMLQHLKDARHFKAFNLALGDQSGEVTIQRSSDDPASSILPMTDVHKGAFPTSASSTPVAVKLERLDTVAQDMAITEPMLIKIDVQGYESFVLKGGQKTVRRARIVIIETSFKTLYEGQSLFSDIYQMMNDLGFDYYGAMDQLFDPRDGTPIQEDSLFVKRDAI